MYVVYGVIVYHNPTPPEICKEALIYWFQLIISWCIYTTYVMTRTMLWMWWNRAAVQDHLSWIIPMGVYRTLGACFKVINKVDGGRTYVIGRLPEDPLLFITRAKSFGSRISKKFQYICHESLCDSEGRGHWRIGFCYDDVMTCKRFSDNWPFVRGIDRLPLDHPHKGPIMRNFDIFLATTTNKLLNKQWSGDHKCYTHS